MHFILYHKYADNHPDLTDVTNDHRNHSLTIHTMRQF